MKHRHSCGESLNSIKVKCTEVALMKQRKLHLPWQQTKLIVCTQSIVRRYCVCLYRPWSFLTGSSIGLVFAVTSDHHYKHR